MQVFLSFVVLVFSIALILYALPIILYIAPLFVVGLVISFLTSSVRHPTKTVKH